MCEQLCGGQPEYAWSLARKHGASTDSFDRERRLLHEVSRKVAELPDRGDLMRDAARAAADLGRLKITGDVKAIRDKAAEVVELEEKHSAAVADHALIAAEMRKVAERARPHLARSLMEAFGMVQKKLARQLADPAYLA